MDGVSKQVCWYPPEICFSVGVLWLCKLKNEIFQQLMTSFASNGQNKNISSELGLCKHVADCSQGTQGVNNAVNIFFPYGLLWRLAFCCHHFYIACACCQMLCCR